jgi:DNA-directed RNA polymerase subunit E"
MKNLKACKVCSFLSEENECPICNNHTSREWQGYVIIVDHNKSQIAKAIGIETNGKFALRVR